MRNIWILSTLLFHLAVHSAADDDKPVSYRLLEHQKPQKYTLDLEFKKDVFEGTSTEFFGKVQINFLVTRTVNYIQFHAPVTIKSMQFLVNQTIPVPVESESYDPVTAIYTITSKANLNYTYNYTLLVEYSGEVYTSDTKAIYRGSYLDDDGSLQYFIATHFQPTYARFAFPSFDEPKMKAIFLISVTYPKGLSALSNTVQNGEVVVIDDQYEKVTFKETPIMSTYVVGFLLSKLTCSHGKNLTNDVPYRVCSKNVFEDDRQLALGLGPPFIEKLENITALNYSDHLLGKLDQVALPGYTKGFMENWGLITYKEPSLLWNSKESSVAYRNVVMDLFLELAHFWFGNLETCEWWDVLFLNHGFARFYQYYAANQTDQLKHWELDKQFVIDQQQPALVLDALPSSQSLSYPVKTPSEILTKFNTFSYSKGASIFRMAQHVIGPDNFQKGIRYFLPIYNGSTILPVYVWNKLEVFIPRELLPKTKNLNGAMENWTEEAGFPLVTVSLKGNNILLTQERFLYSRETDFTEWFIPITYTLSGDLDRFQNTTTKVWILPGTSQTIYDVMEENDWIILNNQQVGYYRVNYDPKLWEKIKEILYKNHSIIHVLNRAQIVDDVLNLARAKIVNYSFAFDTINYLSQEEDYYPWYSAITNFNFLLMHLGEDSVLGKEVSSMALELLQNVYQTLSFENVDADDLVYILKLTTISSTACRFGEDSCIKKAKDLLTKYKSGKSFDKNLRGVVYCNSLRYSEDITSDWNFLWKIFQSETLASERDTLINSLGCSRNSTILKHYLDQTLTSSSGINMEDFPKVWSAVYSSNSEGIDAAFDYLSENYNTISAYYPSTSSLLTSITDRFTRDDQLKKLEIFTTSGNLEPSVRVIAQSALKSTKEKLEWLTDIENDLLIYFDVRESDSTTTATEETHSTTPGAGNRMIVSFVNWLVIITLSRLIVL